MATKKFSMPFTSGILVFMVLIGIAPGFVRATEDGPASQDY